MRSYLFLPILVLALSIGLSACQVESRDLICEQLLANALQPYIGQEITADTFIEVVEKAYDLPTQDIQLNRHKDGSWFLNWNQHGLGYGVLSKNGKYLDLIGINYGAREFSVKRLFECVSTLPEWYWAAYGSNPPTMGIRYAFTLYFPMQGIVATAGGSGRNPKELPHLNEDITISDVFIGTPGSLSDLYKQRWEHSLEGVRSGLHPLPWPKDWNEVRFIEDQGLGW